MTSLEQYDEKNSWDHTIQVSNACAVRQLNDAIAQAGNDKDNGGCQVNLCSACRRIDFATAIEAAETSDLLHITLLDKGKKLQDGCPLCCLFFSYMTSTQTNNITHRVGRLALSASTFNGYILDGQTSRLFKPLRNILLFPGQDSKDLKTHRDKSESASQGFIGITRTEQLKQYYTDRTMADGARSHLVQRQYNPAFVRHWLALADETDIPICGPPNIARMTVIDCATFNIIELSHGMDYVALSYVWKLANADMVRLEGIESSMPDCAKNIAKLPQIVPRVISNSIAVTRDLAFRYLWVDQYCIDQTAGNENLQEHISRMDEVYASAKLTIIAASTGGALPGVEGTERSSQKLIHLPSRGDHEEGFTIFTTTPQVYGHIQNSVWYQRGWCFQESVLSTRRLYFTDHETFFQTQSLAFSETYPEPHEDLEASLRGYGEAMSLSELLSETNIQDEWSDEIYPLDDPRGQFWVRLGLFSKLLEVYSQKELSHMSDSINGFRGVLKSFSRSSQSFGSVSGLPLFLADPDLRASLSLTSQPLTDGTLPPESLDYMTSDCSTYRAYNAQPEVVTHDATSSAADISVEEVIRFRHAALTALLLWRHDAHNQHEEISVERRTCFPSWSWAGWKGKVNWGSEYWDFKFESHGDDEETKIEGDPEASEFRISTDLYGRSTCPSHSNSSLEDMIDWRLDSIQCKSGQVLNLRDWSLSTNNSQACDTQHFDDAQYLIGEALVLQHQDLLLMHSWSTLSELSKLYKICSVAKRMLWKTFRLMRDFKPTSSLAKWPGQLALRRKLYKLSKTVKCSALFETLQRLEVSVASFSVDELANLPLKSPSLEREVFKHLDEGSWGLLMVDSRRLLVVEWERKTGLETGNDIAKDIQRNDVRVCSRVGLLEFSHYLRTGHEAEKDKADILQKATRVRFCMK